MPYIYRVSRRTTPKPAAEPMTPARLTNLTTKTTTVTVKTNGLPAAYRDLQSQAKALGIKANQPADDLKKAIEGAGNG